MQSKSNATPGQYPLLPAVGFIHLGDPDHNGASKLEESFQPILEYLQQANSRAYLGYELFSQVAPDDIRKKLEKNQDRLTILHLQAEEKVYNSKSWEVLLNSINSMPALKLVFLDGFATSDLIQTLFDAGTPAVVATRKSIDATGYLTFLIDFYQNLLKGKNLKDALNRASWELRKANDEDTLAWNFFNRKESLEYLKRANDPDFLLPPGIYVNQSAPPMPAWEIYHPENQPESFSFLKPLYPTQTRLHSDRWGEEDFLGYEPYARVIAGIINDKDSEPPLTIAIIAPWGYGKTTLMHYIREYLLQDETRKPTPPPSATKAGYQQIRQWVREGASNDPRHYHPVQRPMVWFNPWHYQSSEQVWSGMAHAIITQLVENLPPLEQEEFWFKLQYKRIDFQAIRLDIHKSIVTRLIPYFLLFTLAVIAMVFAFSMGAADLWKIVSGLFASGSVGQAIWEWYSRRSKGVEEKYDQYLSAPNYESGMGLFHEINEDLSTVFELLVSPEEPVVVFIDDLDRCSPEKVVEVTEAINLLVNGDYRNKCFFVIGMDAQVVAAALDVAYRGMRGKLKDREEAVGSVGWYFLDKFIQLPFIIPSLNTEKKSNYLHNLFKVHPKERHEDGFLFNPPSSASKTLLSDEELKQKAHKLLELSQNNEDRTSIEKIRKELGKENEKVIDGLILDRALESNKDDGAIFQQLRIYSDFLQPSPRSLKRFANMLRFHTTLQQLKDTKSFDYAPTESLAKWLTISLRWPQLVRWIQWERADKFIAELGGGASSKETPRKLFLSKPREKAGILDELINRMPSFEDIKSLEEKDELYYQQWLPFADANRDLSWLKDKELFLILYEKNTPEARLEKALDFNVW